MIEGWIFLVQVFAMPTEFRIYGTCLRSTNATNVLYFNPGIPNTVKYTVPVQLGPCITQPIPQPHVYFHYCAFPAAFSAAILASIFFLAANIISSRLLCSAACLSSRLELHAFAFAARSASLLALTLSCRLYLVIRSGSAGLGGALKGCVCVVPDGEGEVGGGGGWNVTGG